MDTRIPAHGVQFSSLPFPWQSKMAPYSQEQDFQEKAVYSRLALVVVVGGGNILYGQTSLLPQKNRKFWSVLGWVGGEAYKIFLYWN